jgi:hypothetical protein
MLGNVRSLYRAGLLVTVSEELSKYKLDLVGVHEVRWEGGGTKVEGINSAWETIEENIKISAKENLGYYESKKHKPFYEGCSKLTVIIIVGYHCYFIYNFIEYPFEVKSLHR